MYRRMVRCVIVFLFLFLALIHMADTGVMNEAFGADPPTVSISANPLSVVPNRSSTLSWNSTNAATCSIDHGIGTVAASGTKRVTVPATTTYTITATGPGGTATASVTVTIAPRPTLTFSADPYYIRSGQSSTLTWSTTGATSCFADWLGKIVSTSGTSQVTPTKTRPYSMTATGPGGQVDASATVTIVDPTVTISASPAAINVGEVSTLSWSSAKSNSCVIDQGIGGVPPTDSITVGPTQTTTYTITCTDPLDGTAMASATVTVTPPPTVTISANPASVITGQSSTLTWSATDAVSCSIDRGIGAVSTSGTQTVSPTKTTTYTITATGYGGTATAAATVTVNTASRINITITSPADGETVTGTSVMVKGTVSNSFGNETGVTVNGIIAAVYNNEFAVNHVPLVQGTNTITVIATDTTGTASKSITVNATAPGHYIRVTSNPQSGMAPLEVALRINGSFSVSNPVITPQGPGTVEQLASASADIYRYKMTTEGIYYFTVQATGPDNNVYQNTVAVTVLSATQLDALLRAKWTSMTDALQRKDIDAALSLMHSSRKSDYQTMFNVLKDQLPTIVANYTELVLFAFEEDGAKYELKTLENNEQYSYRVYFIKGENGLWYIKVF